MLSLRKFSVSSFYKHSENSDFKSEPRCQKQLQVMRLNTPRMVSIMEMAIQQGTSVLIENLEQSIDPVLAPVVGRLTIRRGRSQYLKLGDKEVPYNTNFRLFLQTRLSNPHYPPELHAECTLINFTVTEKVKHFQKLLLLSGGSHRKTHQVIFSL